MDRKSQVTTAPEDRISDLPDCMIHHILSFLPSIKEAIQTSILSKRWLKQWTHVPVLIFNYSTGISHENFLNFVDNTLILHGCSKIKKFHIDYPYKVDKDPQFDSKILFAIQKHVEELYLNSNWQDLPQFLFKTASSLVKLTASNSILMPHRKVNWTCLTALKLYFCKLNDQAVQHILSGSPVLELLELICCSELDNLVIVSKSLKKLAIHGHGWIDVKISAIEISCPNLVEFTLRCVEGYNSVLFAQLIENVLSSPLLESFVLDEINSPLHNLVISSKSLKRLVLGLNYKILNLHVSCPQLELFVLSGIYHLTTAKLHDLPSLLSATFDFNHYKDYDDVMSSIRKTLVKDILQKVHHVKQLTIGNSFINILSTLVVGDPFPSVLNVKSLTLNDPNLNNHCSGIARLLRHAPELEKLVIKAPNYYQTELETLENFWNSADAAVFNCLVSQLKTIKIIGLPKRPYELMCLINFVRFLLNNARVLEKLIVVTEDRTEESLRIFQKLLELPRYSKHAIVELL